MYEFSEQAAKPTGAGGGAPERATGAGGAKRRTEGMGEGAEPDAEGGMAASAQDEGMHDPGLTGDRGFARGTPVGACGNGRGVMADRKVVTIW